MKLLVIDNLTIGLPQLNKALAKYPHDVINYKKLNLEILKNYDKIILSGGHGFSVLHPNNKYIKELDLIKKSKKPIFGICIDFLFICSADEANMTDLINYEKGILKISKIKDDVLLKGLPKEFFVFENHRHVVKKVSKKLIPLALSKDGIEAIRHPTKQIFGVQFHPEHFEKRNLGRKMLENFIKM